MRVVLESTQAAAGPTSWEPETKGSAKTFDSISRLPAVPAIYAMYGGDTSRHVAYVGMGKSLKGRVAQHLVRRDSSVVTGTTAVGLNVNHVREVAWWVDQRFADPVVLEAAELVAFDVLDPVLRSRGRPSQDARKLSADDAFQASMQTLFEGEPDGRLLIPTLPEAVSRIAALEERISAIERQLEKRR
jgi:hypothetical protein